MWRGVIDRTTQSGIGFEPQTVVMLTVNINWIELYPMSFTDH